MSALAIEPPSAASAEALYVGEPAARLVARLRRSADEDAHARHRAFLFSARHSEFSHADEQLSAKLVLGGQVHFTLRRRELVLDEAHVLFVNPGTHYRAVTMGEGAALHGATLWFEPGLLAKIDHALRQPDAIDAEPPRARPDELRERLQPLDAAARSLLNALIIGLRQQQPTARLDELITMLLAHWCGEQQRIDAAGQRLAARRASTRAELLRRIDRATDYMASCYADALTLDDIAAAAAMSKYHLLRVFTQVHGVTPHQHLEALRSAAARRLLVRGGLDLDEVACRCGFGSRWTLQRALRRHFGASGSALRERQPSEAVALGA